MNKYAATGTDRAALKDACLFNPAEAITPATNNNWRWSYVVNVPELSLAHRCRLTVQVIGSPPPGNK